jgi:hypothetical protein
LGTFHAKEEIFGINTSCFPFSTVLVSDTKVKRNLVCMHKEVNKTISFRTVQGWYYGWERYMKYAFEMKPGDMVYITSLTKFGSGV